MSESRLFLCFGAIHLYSVHFVLPLQIIGTVITYELVMLDEVSNQVTPETDACNGSIYFNLNSENNK